MTNCVSTERRVSGTVLVLACSAGSAVTAAMASLGVARQVFDRVLEVTEATSKSRASAALAVAVPAVELLVGHQH